MKHCQNKSNLAVIKDYLDGDRPFTTVGYTGRQYVKRKTRDKWTDSKGIEWEQKISGPVRVNRVADIVRAATNDKCYCGQEIKWGSRADKILFRKTGLCSNCLTDYETKLRIVGIYDDYEKYKIISNEIGILNDTKSKVEDVIKFFSNDNGDVEMVCNSEGFVERWKTVNREQILEDAKKDLKIIKKQLLALKKLKKVHKNKYIEGTVKYKLKSYAR